MLDRRDGEMLVVDAFDGLEGCVGAGHSLFRSDQTVTDKIIEDRVDVAETRLPLQLGGGAIAFLQDHRQDVGPSGASLPGILDDCVGERRQRAKAARTCHGKSVGYGGLENFAKRGEVIPCDPSA